MNITVQGEKPFALVWWVIFTNYDSEMDQSLFWIDLILGNTISNYDILTGRKLVGGSDIGGMKETQEMLDFCAEHGIAADIELIRMEDVNKAMERLTKSDVRYRFVIDVANSLPQ